MILTSEGLACLTANRRAACSKVVPCDCSPLEGRNRACDETPLIGPQQVRDSRRE